MQDTSEEEIEMVMECARRAYIKFSNTSLSERANFLRQVADALEHSRELLITTASGETRLPEERLNRELTRTIFQLTNYAGVCESGLWLDVRIESENAGQIPSKPALAKTMIALGPVVVFGAANFPFAYSTAGGDTACAFAAGCPVIVKAHPEHLETSILVGGLITKVAAICKLPPGVFAHVIGNSISVGETLVKHPLTKAVGFTGSFAGGRQLFDWGNQRNTPIPVFAEMSSVNPVFLLPDKTHEDAAGLAKMLASSITLNAGQFCTNPGVIVAVENEDLDEFVEELSKALLKSVPEPMLNPGIYKNYIKKRATAISQDEVKLVATAAKDAGLNEGTPTLVSVPATQFVNNTILQQEVFGPYSILVKCADMIEMHQVAASMEGQLTATLMASTADILQNESLVNTVKNLCGRLLLNNVPTGVEVALGMQHGGPYPATTDSRFTAVGGDGIRRFARPLSFQNWPDELLPAELKKGNPLRIWRTVDGELNNS